MVNLNSCMVTTLADCLEELGGIPASRVRLSPPPGQATLADLLAVNQADSRGLFELVDGTLVEKGISYEASVVAATILFILKTFVSRNRSGLISGADGFFQLQSSTRGPDVAYVARERLPGGVFPSEPYPKLSPNLVVEVLSPSNTKAEMSRKRREYFHAGVDVVWIVDCVNRSVAVYTSPFSVKVFGEHETVDCTQALPGFSSPVSSFFADLDIGVEQS